MISNFEPRLKALLQSFSDFFLVQLYAQVLEAGASEVLILAGAASGANFSFEF